VRFEQLTLERYGAFTDRVLSFRQGAALHVVLGANEAGKTTALTAIGDFLFGFGARTDHAFRHDSKTLRIGATLCRRDGSVITARRRKGNKNTLVDGDDQPLLDDLLTPLLAGLTRPTFDAEFGLTARALRDGGHELLKADGRLAETLAASSAGMTALSRLRQQLQDSADELFTARRSAGKPFYVAAERRDGADRALREAIVTRDALRRAEDAVTAARQQLDDLNAAHAQSGTTLARWQRVLRTKAQLAKLDGVAAELAALADLPEISTTQLSAWEAAFASCSALDQQVATLDQAAATAAAEIAASAPDQRVLAEGALIDALRERLGAVRKAIDDLPRRQQAREAAQTSLNGAARRLGLPSHVELLQKLPTDPALAEARELIDKWRSAEQQLARAEERAARASREHDEFAALDAAAAIVVDIEQARQRFAALGDLSAKVERYHLDAASWQRDAGSVAAQLAALDPCPGSAAQLRALPLPDGAAIARFAREFAVREAELQRLQDEVADQDNEIARSEHDLAQFAGEASVPTRADLIEARRSRNEQMAASRAALDHEREQRARLLDQLESSLQHVDDVTDRLLSDTERATRREDAQQRLASSRLERAALARKLDDLRQRCDELQRDWIALWRSSAIKPRTPAEMQSWRERVDGLLERLGRCDHQQAALDVLAASIASAKTAVIAFLEWSGRAGDPALPAEVLYQEAKARLTSLQDAWTEARSRDATRQRIARDQREAEGERTAAQAALAADRAAWPAAMRAIGVGEQATAAQAAAALEVWNAVATPKANYEIEQHRVVAIEADLTAFERDVAALAGRIAPELAGHPPQQALTELTNRLGAARRADDNIRRLQDIAEQRAAQHRELQAQRAVAAQLLDQARATFAVDDIAALAEPLRRAAARQALEVEQARLRRDLHEIADGHDESALRQERAGLDLDTLPAEIDREQLQQAQLLKQIETASAAWHQACTHRDQLSRGRNAAAAAAERADADAELLSIAERWLLRAAAAKLAGRAVERHRQRVQDPLITRAGELFALATAGAFAGLGVDFDDDDRPVLVTRRSSDERVPVAGLSEGTRDQLFLALRLAMLDGRHGEPLPFIGDDLLASFDEPRTAAMLQLLAAAGARQQIIVFTHHRHVAELAAALPNAAADIIAL
jgi:uncharacterized protein YhaN